MNVFVQRSLRFVLQQLRSFAASCVVLVAIAIGMSDVQPVLAADSETAVVQALGNLIYRGILDEPVLLADGKFEGAPFVAGGSSRPSVVLHPHFRIRGDLTGDGRDEIVALLSANSGGSGSEQFLAVVADPAGSPTNLVTIALGDRVQVKSGRVIEHAIELSVVQAGENDSACCPSQVAVRRWSFALHEAPIKVLGALSIKDLSDVNWVLQGGFGNENESADAGGPTLIIIDGRVSGHGGCNRFSGDAKTGASPGEISLGPLVATRMLCPDPVGARETRFLRALESVSVFSFQGGQLALNWNRDTESGVLIFARRKN